MNKEKQINNLIGDMCYKGANKGFTIFDLNEAMDEFNFRKLMTYANERHAKELLNKLEKSKSRK